VSGAGVVSVSYDSLDAANESQFTLRYRSSAGPRPADALWKPRQLGKWKSQIVRVQAEKSAALEVSPSAIVFWGTQNRRKIELRNNGKPFTLGQPLTPPDYRLVTENGDTITGLNYELKPGAPITLWVERRSMGAPSGKLVFRDEQLRSIGRPLDLLSIVDKGVRELAEFVIGIDFGTSNTSVIVKHVLTGEIKELEYPDKVAASKFQEPDLVRFPTTILINGKDPMVLEYGFAAISDYTPTRGDVIVEELKSLLRGDDEPFTWKHPNLRVDYLLAWYFRKLREDLIDPYLRSVLGDVAASNVYILSLPVLDCGSTKSVLFEKQRSRTLAAAKAAGFGDNIQTVHEPVAAALRILKEITSNKAAEKIRFSGGDRLVVFDSGGGTTDVAVFTVKFEHGKYVMDEIDQIGSHLATVNGEQIARHFGGTVITQDLGYVVCQYYLKKGYPILQLLNTIEGCNPPYATFDEVYCWSQEKYLYQRTPEPNEFLSEGAKSRTELAWYRRFYGLYLSFEEKKLKLSSGAEDKQMVHYRLNQELEQEGYQGEQLPNVTREDLQGIVDNHLPALCESIRSDLWDSGDGRPIKALFSVGGNTRLRQVLTAVEPAVNPQVKPPITDELRSHAVALGTVEAYEPKAAVAPYFVRLVMRESNAVLFETSPQRIQQGYRRQYPYQMLPNAEIVIDRFVGIDEADTLAESIRLVNEAAETRTRRIRIQEENQSLAILEIPEGSGAPIEIYRYDI
jgi:hypothetical protein